MKENVYFINAHPDDLDAAIGLAVVLRDTGHFNLKIVDLTGGEKALLWKDVPPEECAAIRKIEEEKVASELNAELYWIGQPDGAACATPEACRKIADLFMEAPPKVIVTHWLIDTHVDHVMAGAAALHALRICSGLEGGMLRNISAEVYFYDHIRNALANPHQILFPFDEKVMQEKMRIIRLYESQDGGRLADLRELENRYYGCRGRVPYAEAYTGFQPITPGKNRFFDELEKIRN